MIERKTWEEFRNSGLLWWINRGLHLFGWAIIVTIPMDNKNNIIDVYPARVKFRGFDCDTETEGFIKTSQYLMDNIDELVKESKE